VVYNNNRRAILAMQKGEGRRPAHLPEIFKACYGENSLFLQ
jgi:hypothetical protein